MTASRRMAGLGIVTRDRAANTAGRPYLYILMVGVTPTHQGKGLGSSLLRALMADCDEQGLPIYLETETQENVRMYDRYGFELVKQVTLEKLGLPMWEMMREPNADRT
jgi:ribosomal protein S18 acetylase RimI-like enzyme